MFYIPSADVTTEVTFDVENQETPLENLNNYLVSRDVSTIKLHTSNEPSAITQAKLDKVWFL